MDVNLSSQLRQKMAPWPRVRGRYNSSELYFINNGSTTPQDWLNPTEKDMKQLLMMWSGIGMHNQLGDLLGKQHCERKKEMVYKDIILVAKADYIPPHTQEEVWEFKTSNEKIDRAKPWFEHQVKLYCTLFDKPRGLIFQPVQDNNGLYLKHIKTVERDDAWFEKEIEKLYEFHLKVEEHRLKSIPF